MLETPYYSNTNKIYELKIILNKIGLVFLRHAAAVAAAVAAAAAVVAVAAAAVTLMRKRLPLVKKSSQITPGCERE